MNHEDSETQRNPRVKAWRHCFARKDESFCLICLVPLLLGGFLFLILPGSPNGRTERLALRAVMDRKRADLHAPLELADNDSSNPLAAVLDQAPDCVHNGARNVE